MIATSKLERNRWAVYLLISGNRTYVGATTDVHRRLRQHNREIVGGARSTEHAAGTWKLYMYLTGFKNRSECMRWEAIVKKRARGMLPRTAAMLSISRGICPGVTKTRKNYKVPKGIRLEVDCG